MAALTTLSRKALSLASSVLLLGAVAIAQVGQVKGTPSPAGERVTPIGSGEKNSTGIRAVENEEKSRRAETDAPAPEQTGTVVAAPTTGSPAVAPSPEMLIGSGDLLEVSVYGAPDYVKQVRVNSSGEITLPLAGTLQVGGKTTAEAEKVIATRLSEGKFFNDPKVSVLEKEFATQGISVLGEVQKPGIYPLPGPRSLYDALSAAGGTTQRAGNVVAITHRANPQRRTVVNMTYDGRTSDQANIPVYPGDTIVVSKAGVVYVVGDVRMPGGFIMENAHMTILQAVAMAQGTNPTASLDKARLIRKSGQGNQPSEISISLKKILTAKQPDVNLQPDDIVFIPNSKARSAGRRTVDTIVQIATGMAVYGRGY